MTEPTDPVERMPRRPEEPSDQERLIHRRTIVLRNLTIALVVLFTVGLLVTVAWTTVTIRESQVANTEARKSSDRTLAAIQDCTQPNGKCYRRGQSQTADAVGNINRVVILAAACSVGLDQRLSVGDRQAAIQQCVIDRLSTAGNP